MSADIIRIVDAPSATPVVRFDFNDESPCGVAKFSAPPPQLVRTTFQTQARDGANEASSVYGDRVLELDLDLYAESQAVSAATMQKMFRLLSDRNGQWLQYQPVGAPAPVFFRLKRGDVSSIADIAATAALRELHLTLPAEPFAYGLRVTGSELIDNDPTSATNPMSFVFPEIQGDVTTPLWLEWQYATAVGNHHVRSIVACSSGDVTPSAPPCLILNTTTPDTQTGWTDADQLDATFLNGTRRRLTKSSGTNLTTVASEETVALEPGDYRVLARCVAPPGASLVLANGDVPVLTYKVPTTSPGELTWYDMGVARLPLMQPPLDSALGLVPSLSTALSFQVGLSTATGVIDADALLFIPVGLDRGVDASYAACAPGFASTGFTYNGTLDGLNDLAYTRVDFGFGDTNAGAIAVGGGMPSVTPGVKNVLYLLPWIFAGALDGQPDSKVSSSTVTYIYYPRYLHVRPATT